MLQGEQPTSPPDFEFVPLRIGRAAVPAIDARVLRARID